LSDINITVIDHQGVSHKLIAPTEMNMNLMEVCKSYNLPVEGVCGGMAMCASCQVYVHTDKHFGERNDDEEAMLDEAYNVKSNSRLGCQIPISIELEGAKFELSPKEH
jgi:2Fe-2S ferredoxin